MEFHQICSELSRRAVDIAQARKKNGFLYLTNQLFYSGLVRFGDLDFTKFSADLAEQFREEVYHYQSDEYEENDDINEGNVIVEYNRAYALLVTMREVKSSKKRRFI